MQADIDVPFKVVWVAAPSRSGVHDLATVTWKAAGEKAEFD